MNLFKSNNNSQNISTYGVCSSCSYNGGGKSLPEAKAKIKSSEIATRVANMRYVNSQGKNCGS